jgi:hypothetical protein
MLRWITGDEAFFQACRDYLDGPETAYAFGRTSDFRQFLEARSGKDLDEFFADWFYGQGHPSYQLRWRQQADSLVLWLGQQPSHPSVSFFEMPVPVRVILNGIEYNFVLPHEQQDQRFSFSIGNTNVDAVTLDPDRWLLSRNNTITELSTSTFHPIAQDKYFIHPNPAIDFIEIFPSEDITTVTIIDVYGRSITLPLISGRIDLNQYTPGYYTLILRNATREILSIKPVVILK